MPSWTIAFSLGVVLAGIAPALPEPRWLPLLLVVPLLSLRQPRFFLAGAFLLGVWWALLGGRDALDDWLPPELEQADLWVEGKVRGLVQHTPLGQRFAFEVEQWCPRPVALSRCEFSRPVQLRGPVRLNHYGEGAFAPGQRWRLKVRLKRPHGFANPGGFDYEAWLLQQGVSATGYVREDRGNAPVAAAGGAGFDGLRHDFRLRLEALFPADVRPLRQAALIKALTIGDHYDITDADWELFSATGTNHLMVISGLHLGLVALLGYWLCAFTARLVPRLLLYVPAPRWGALGALLAAGGYAGLAGFTLPVQRSLIMVVVLMLGRLLGRQTSARHSLCLALGLVLLLDPLAPQNTGLWLSFGAVALLLYLAPPVAANSSALPEPRLAWRSGAVVALARAAATVKTQLGLCLGLLPLMLVFFQQTSLLAPLVNLPAIPLVGLVVVPLCLLGLVLLWIVPALARFPFLLADWLLDVLMLSMEAVVAWLPRAVLELPAVPWWALGLLAAGILLLLSSAHWMVRALAPAVFLPLLLAGPERLPQGAFRLHVLDVGQGLAAVVETAGHRLVYDAGPAYSARFDAGSGVLLPFLRARNLGSVDTVVISHGDLDHAGGLPAVLQRFPTARYLAGEVAAFPADAAVEACRAGQRWVWDGVEFAILHPEGGGHDGNDASCVLRIATGARAALLPGDIEAVAERALLRRDPLTLRADIVVAPHHGSRTSSTPAFVRAVAPSWVVYSSGYLNRFNHPANDVQSRYERAGARALNTAYTGAVSFLVTGEGEIKVELWRLQRRRYWSTPPEPPDFRLDDGRPDGRAVESPAGQAATRTGP